MSWSKTVLSSNVAEVGWEDGDLIVTFNKGTVYAYEDVPEETALAMSKAASVGSFLNDEIKSKYSFKRLR